MDQKKLFVVFWIVFVGVFAVIFIIDQVWERETKISQEQAQEDFEKSFSFFVAHGPAPNNQAEKNGMVLSYFMNGGVLD